VAGAGRTSPVPGTLARSVRATCSAIISWGISRWAGRSSQLSEPRVDYWSSTTPNPAPVGQRRWPLNSRPAHPPIAHRKSAPPPVECHQEVPFGRWSECGPLSSRVGLQSRPCIAVRPRPGGPARGTLALAVTGFVVAEKCRDQLRVDIGGDHFEILSLSSVAQQPLRKNRGAFLRYESAFDPTRGISPKGYRAQRPKRYFGP
jgi:hypothetical protein